MAFVLAKEMPQGRETLINDGEALITENITSQVYEPPFKSKTYAGPTGTKRMYALDVLIKTHLAA